MWRGTRDSGNRRKQGNREKPVKSRHQTEHKKHYRTLRSGVFGGSLGEFRLAEALLSSNRLVVNDGFLTTDFRLKPAGSLPTLQPPFTSLAPHSEWAITHDAIEIASPDVEASTDLQHLPIARIPFVANCSRDRSLTQIDRSP